MLCVMHTSSNTGLVITELVFLIYGIPVLGLGTAAWLWHRSRDEGDADRKQYQRLGYGGTCYAFVIPLMISGTSALPPSMDTLSSVGWLPILSLSGVLVSITSVVLLVVNETGILRLLGPTLSLLSLTYSVFSIFAMMAGASGL